MRQEMDVEKKGGGAGWPEKDWRTGNDQGLLLPYFIGEERGDEAKPAANRCTGKYANRTEQLEEEEEKEEGKEDCADWEACGWTAGRRDNDEGKVVRRKAWYFGNKEFKQNVFRTKLASGAEICFQKFSQDNFVRVYLQFLSRLQSSVVVYNA